MSCVIHVQLNVLYLSGLCWCVLQHIHIILDSNECMLKGMKVHYYL